MKDNWKAGDAYEKYMGRWSRPLACSFVRWLSPPNGANWLEVGCGTGALTAAICELAFPERVLACDPSEAFVRHARAELADERVSFVVAAAEDLPRPKGDVDYIVSGLVLNFLADPENSIEAMLKAVRKGGTISASVWDYQKGIEFLRCFWDAAVEIDPAAADLDEGQRFPICQPSRLDGLFSGAGLQEVRRSSIETATHFRNFEDLWMPFLKGTGPAPSYVASLPEMHRDALRAQLRKRLPTAADGSIHLNARAWAIKGTAPT